MKQKIVRLLTVIAIGVFAPAVSNAQSAERSPGVVPAEPGTSKEVTNSQGHTEVVPANEHTPSENNSGGNNSEGGSTGGGKEGNTGGSSEGGSNGGHENNGGNNSGPNN